ncbi:unnamed protein product [Aspergillus oryzae RIB40]|uniref:DNA, SC003 n=1 Tax=Aspergillus oryzae (strain ATCC 42149 / RIB 40) TaxID=510516 RepID=Q2ULX7_ASPOR|nr:unnamed protein product [Aspergillus oryzae RIB40]BAE57438.1 unnamed protein product [Aspergillus oryzae RIB40]
MGLHSVYAVDTFTAVNLLAFSKWAGQIEPAIPFTVSRWIFAVCIIISFVLLVLRWIRAIRAIRSGSISQSYLDSLAVRLQSIRLWSSGHGWKRFLVFAELTKSKKGADLDECPYRRWAASSRQRNHVVFSHAHGSASRWGECVQDR